MQEDHRGAAALLEDAQPPFPRDRESMGEGHELEFLKYACYCQVMAPASTTRKRYRQFCGLARALDVVGDRWTLLVIRELLIGPRRYRDLQAGLPGIATNLLAARLRQLERDGLVDRRLEQEPEDGTKYALTGRGEALRSVIEGLVRWSAPLMSSGIGADEFRSAWLAVALPALLEARPSEAVRIGVETSGEHLLLEVSAAGVIASLGKVADVEVTLSAKPGDVLGLASGALTLQDALRRGARTSGDRRALARVFGSSPRSRP